ncbi:4-hydroxybenzoyl-CoA thioesterase [Paenibacillus curdlanolyticus YK9]|uniref:4-hydroxybenzoyl-CoA thioesterase n=1 Tax=Paenibacillus curdlanolyticus YK9 TaxID=717606 RepID=E0I8M8_9BACL|nr:thioesterase family protein [Paenibacillus curdlanolyticus]EFM11533.1 4-hydroxybenzoyl-CoA thioesterase [Paenibacillus curdlanolyticus YK9]
MFAIERRVSPEEVDIFRVVHFSNYLKWCSAAMTEMFHRLDVGIGSFDGDTVEIRVGKLQMVYIRSVRLNDVATIKISQIVVKSNRMELSMSVSVGENVCARGRLTVAFVEAATGAITRCPEELSDKLSAWNLQQEAGVV